MGRKLARNEAEYGAGRHSFGGKAPSGLRHSWRLWRFCCCRYGWYPLLVAPIVTVGCLFSLYSAVGCDFIRVNVGFTPSNPGWDNGTLEVGLFLYQSGEEDANKYYAAFVDGCRAYTEEFTDEFVKDDRTWRVAQIMAYVSGSASMIATISTWLFVVSPLPARFFWPVVVVPALVASFLAEASKFLFYDTSICRKSVWFPPGTESLPRTAECSLGATAVYGIASTTIFLICLVLVCLKAPSRRDLEPNYGLDVENGNIDVTNQVLKNRSYDSEYGRNTYANGNNTNGQQVGGGTYYSREEDGESGVISMNSRGHESGYDPSITAIAENENDILSEHMSESVDQIGNGGSHNPLGLPTADVTILRNNNGSNPYTVSKSRLETVERMEKSANDLSHSSAQMLDQFLTDLDQSFEAGSNQNENSR